LSNNRLLRLDNGLFGLKSLEFLALEGNKLGEVADINNLAVVSTTLTSLFYKNEALDNLVTGEDGYYETATRVCPNLRVLDGESVVLNSVCADLGVGENIEADEKYIVPLEVEDWLGGEAPTPQSAAIVDDNDVKENTVVLKEVLNEITGDLGRAKAALRSADRELERLHVM
jgi:hypothetical protein